MSNSAKNSKKKMKFFEKLQVSNAKTKGIFFKKKKLVSNDSELSNSARNDIKKFRRKMAVFRRERRLKPPKPKNTSV